MIILFTLTTFQNTGNMSIHSSTAYQDSMSDPVSGSMEGQSVDMTAVEGQDSLDPISDSQLTDLDASGQTCPTDPDGENQGSMHLGLTKERHGVV